MAAQNDFTSPPGYRLPHGWRLKRPEAARELTESWIRPALCALPSSIAALLPPCEIHLEARIGPQDAASRWRLGRKSLEIAVATDAVDPHDVSLELLTCVGQALWEVIEPRDCGQWLRIVQAEIGDGVTGEIDEPALEEKRKLLESAVSARSAKRLAAYSRASFAGTVAEYVHSLWHDVTVRTGPEHLPPRYLRRRLELMERWFPPNRGYRLFPEERHLRSTGRRE